MTIKGQRPIYTVMDLMQYLGSCDPNAEVCLVPEEGDPLRIGGVLEFSAQKPSEVWILIDEFTEFESTAGVMDWSGGPSDDDPALDSYELEEESLERPGDMGEVREDFERRVRITTERHNAAKQETDVVAVRGKMREA